MNTLQNIDVEVTSESNQNHIHFRENGQNGFNHDRYE